jgi:hypothetical protein
LFVFSKTNLEVEIIIYRQLLNAAGIEIPAPVAPYRVQPVASETTENFVIKRQRRGSIGISKCDMKK